MKDECPYLLGTYLGNIRAQTVTAQEIVEVSHTIGDNGYGVRALTLRSGTELVTMKQTSYVGCKF